MLTHIFVRNFAIIDQLELALGPGMTVLTGETGAGKSILVDAVALALGDRAGPAVIRHGADRAEVCVSFDCSRLEPVQTWLQQHDFTADDTADCQMRRIVGGDGRSKGYINGYPAPMQLLRELGEQLIDIHGQHEHQSLLRRDMQRRLLDEYAGHNELVDRVRDGFTAWQRLAAELGVLQQAAGDRAARIDLLRFQVQELEALAITEDEWRSLEDEQRRLANASRLRDTCELAIARLDDADISAAGTVAEIGHELRQLLAIDPALGAADELIDSAVIQLREAVSELRHYLDRLDLDPSRLAEIDRRLAAIHDIARKHRVAPDELPPLTARLGRELAELEGADDRLDRLQADVSQTREQYRAAAGELSASRAQAAKKLGRLVTDGMQKLGMPGGKFAVALETIDPDRASVHGLEQVEFQVSANPGQPLMPLTRVASGGELSRISLAIQVITVQQDGIPTLVFDEVDVGIGGGVAEIVGEQLRMLGKTRQVLCVTHQPQVAALGHSQLLVSKQTGTDVTHTRIQALDETERCNELARMLGGVKITERTRAHAREMMERGRRD